ncbi:G2/mitotic-specific cyclin-B [Anabrus simplex]|uniref:G2/mitotic-specific cyclin-B n=1 Tax=Anabrus simplex TaxID=316456 RepID=UPI0034DCDA09
MDIRTRAAIAARPGQENCSLLPGKGSAILKEVLPQHRPALGEIGNKVAARQNTNQLPFQEVKKKAFPLKTTTSKVTNVVREKQVKKEEKPLKPEKKVAPSTAPKPELNSYSSNRLNFLDIRNIDEDDMRDPLLLGIYASDIYSYLRTMEAKFPIRENYLDGQKLTGKMRAMLVDWLVEVHLQFQMMHETLYLTVTNLDRFMQTVPDIHRKKFQLVGVAAMFVASKYEEMYTPEISDFVYIADNAFSKADILDMEARIIDALDYSFGRPLAPHFLRRFSKAANALPRQHVMAKYFMELCLIDYELCHILPSQIAAAAIYLVLRLSTRGKERIWTDTLVHYSQYAFKDIAPVVKKMANVIIHAETNKYQAVRKKYSNAKFLNISHASELKSPSLQKLGAMS